MVILGEDDQHLERNGVNPGKTKAKEAAAAVGGIAIFPTFAPGEKTLTSKEFNDFNDLANKSKLGKDAVRRQVKSVVDKSVATVTATAKQDHTQHGDSGQRRRKNAAQ